jgi:hypothetical protein
MKRRPFTLLVVMLVGCSTPSLRSVGTKESQVVEIAREAVREHEGQWWARDAEYRAHQHGEGWTVLAVRPTRHLFRSSTYRIGNDRMISVDEHGTVTSYVRGY